ncbi:MAG: SufD family Fe-S cluster assembly protein [Clostridiales bacterium]|nr:SufD family Fe-S cluster assembly protein [Clostridiales bacterium]
MNAIAANLLKIVSGITEKLGGAYNIRINGKGYRMVSTKNIRITGKPDGSGIDVYVSPGTQNERLHIPVVIDSSGVTDLVYNDFHIGENANIEIIAGCGIHNDGMHLTQHDGIHTFHVGKNARVQYTEKHYGEGSGEGSNVLNPVTIIHLEKGATLEMETVQIDGVDSTERVTKADIADDASLIIKEKLMTGGNQSATTQFEVNLDGKNSSANLISRSVARGHSKQYFYSVINGNNMCSGHSECDAIIMDQAMVKAVPDVTANHVDAALIHEAAIGKIAGEQIMKLRSLGMDEEEAEQEIVNGFLK